MIVSQSRIFSLRFYLFSLIVLIMNILLCAQALYASSLPDSIDWLWRPPPDQARVELRLTSVDGAGKRRFAGVVLNYSSNAETSKLIAEVKTKDQGDRIFCFHCNAASTMNPCDKEDGPMPESSETFIPGIQLSWRILTTGFCRKFKAIKNQQHSDTEHDVFDVSPSVQNNKDAEFKLRIYVSKATELPKRIAYINIQDREVSLINIHEIRNTPWGRVITRSTCIDLQSKSRVLIEIRSGSIGASTAMEGK